MQFVRSAAIWFAAASPCHEISTILGICSTSRSVGVGVKAQQIEFENGTVPPLVSVPGVLQAHWRARERAEIPGKAPVLPVKSTLRIAQKSGRTPLASSATCEFTLAARLTSLRKSRDLGTAKPGVEPRWLFHGGSDLANLFSGK